MDASDGNESRPDSEQILAARDNKQAPFLQKMGLLGLLILLAAVAYWQLGDRLSLSYLAQQESQLRSLQDSFPLLTLVAAFAIYVAVTGLSIPGAAALTLVCGWYFGFWKGLFVVSLGSTSGATIAFLLSRYFLRELVQRSMQKWLAAINTAFESEGAYFLFTLRLVPVVPFFVINAVMGLTKIRGLTFWWVSQLGMLPGTIAYVYAGSTVPSLKALSEQGVGKIISWQLLLAFGLLGLLPILIKKMMLLLPKAQVG